MDRRALRAACSGRQMRRSLVVAIVVGAALNVINQGDVLWSGAPLNWPKLLLTFVVPFLVASYGAYSALARLPAD